MEKEIILRYKLKQALLLLLVAPIMIGLGWFAVFKVTEPFAPFLGVFLAVMGILLLVDAFAAHFLRSNKLSLTEHGITKTSIFGRKFLPWHQVKRMATFRQNHNDFLGFVRKGTPTSSRSLGSFFSNLYGGQYRFRIPLSMISDTDFQELVETAGGRITPEEAVVEEPDIGPDERSDAKAVLMFCGAAVVALLINEAILIMWNTSQILLASIFLWLSSYYFFGSRSRTNFSLSNRLTVSVVLLFFSLTSIFLGLAWYNFIQRSVSVTLNSISELVGFTIAAHLDFSKNSFVYLLTTIGAPIFAFFTLKDDKKRAP